LVKEITQKNETEIVFIGHRNVGKSTLIRDLKQYVQHDSFCEELKNSDIIKELKNGQIRFSDTSGSFTVLNKDGMIDRFIRGDSEKKTVQIVLVGDAKNLKRAISVFLQFSGYQLPMLFCLNMYDEAQSRGITINTTQMSQILGVDVIVTNAREGTGIENIVSHLRSMKVPTYSMEYHPETENQIHSVSELFLYNDIKNKFFAVLSIIKDPGIFGHIEKESESINQKKIQDDCLSRTDKEIADFKLRTGTHYNRKAEDIVQKVQFIKSSVKEPLSSKIGILCMRPLTGIPIAMVLLALMYQFIGAFGATYLVDTINSTLFENLLIPWISGVVRYIPSVFIQDMIVDPDFGILPTGVFLALGLVLPVLFCFYIAFGLLQDSGYLSRLSILLDNIFQKMGLNGKGVIPLIMGFSCVTMAILTTRMLDTKKEKNIASFLLLLGMPCAPLLAVMLVILEKMPVSASITVFGLIFMQILIAGFLADKIIPGVRNPLIMEIIPIRLPRIRMVLKSAWIKTYIFMKEAIPVFVFASLIVFLFERAGGLILLEKISAPVVHGLMGLPEKSVQVFIKTIIRRESGAAELQHLSTYYTNVQLIINLLVMTFLTPCINAIIVLIKERGFRTAMALMLSVMVYAFAFGTVLNYICTLTGVTFT